jgi:Icc-related predicted phosphoesterase
LKEFTRYNWYMGLWFFVSDLHGSLSRYQNLFYLISQEKPDAVLLGGDLLPPNYTSPPHASEKSFIQSTLFIGFNDLKAELSSLYPKVFIILGNDDPRTAETELAEGEKNGLWNYIHFRKMDCGDFTVIGYACVPPTPFMLKDWDRYDVSRFVDLGSISPEEGWRSVQVPINDIKYSTIQSDLELLTDGIDLSSAILLFHAPPHQTCLDRVAVDGKTLDNIPLDIHVGSIAIRRFIEKRQPHITLHGHIHESTRLTGSWREKIGQTWAYSAAHDGVELALVRFDPTKPEKATHSLIY